jgi:hypothetical protein
VNLSPTYKNPADSGSTQGAKLTLDSTAYWNGQTMRRTELIPQTTAAINSGKVWYHFSMMRSAVNPPSIFREHQICFFESHFVEMKSGLISGSAGTSNPALQWFVSGTSRWSTEWDAGVWHNVAYEIVCIKYSVLLVVKMLIGGVGLQCQHGCVLAFNWLCCLDSYRFCCQHFRFFKRRRLASWCSRASSQRPG